MLGSNKYGINPGTNEWGALHAGFEKGKVGRVFRLNRSLRKGAVAGGVSEEKDSVAWDMVVKGRNRVGILEKILVVLCHAG